MKTVFTLFFICVLTNATSQITGKFKTEYDNYGNAYIYFEGKNTSGKTITNLKIICSNETEGTQKEINLIRLRPGDTFSIGNRENWIWHDGDLLHINYSPSKNSEWRCNPKLTMIVQAKNNYKSDRMRTLQIQMAQLQQKLTEAEQTLKLIERIGERNPTAANATQQQNLRQSIQNFQRQIYRLEMEKIKLE